MKLTDQQFQYVREWLKKKCPNPVCEWCKSKYWVINSRLYCSPDLTEKRSQIKYYHPYVLVSCQNCGNNKYFNAILLGLVESDKED